MKDKKPIHKPGMAHNYDPSTWEAEAQAGVWGQSQDTYQGFAKKEKKKRGGATKGAKKLQRESMLVFLMPNCK